MEHIREQLKEFKEKTDAFDRGELNIKQYKGFSGKFGSYAQRGKKGHMLRLRMNAGQVTPQKMAFVTDMADKYQVEPVHFTTCQTIQFHNLEPEQLYEIMDKALDAGIIWYGGGGDYPRNVMCSPLSGTEEEYFDVMPYAKAVSSFLMDFIDAEKMPRKLKVAFSNNRKNASHATFRDLGFTARPDGKFDVYAAGGLGLEPKIGVLVDEAVDPQDVLYDVEAMIRLFRKYGNYEKRTKARTRFMQDTLGAEKLKEYFQQELQQLKKEKVLICSPDLEPVTKKSDGSQIKTSWQVQEQVQPGLYRVRFHPKGGTVRRETFRKLSDAIQKMEGTEIRLAPDETAWIINLTGKEAGEILEIIGDEGAKNDLETSISCVGASICQVGVRDSQGLLTKILKRMESEPEAAAVLPQLHISGCASSCGTHQAGSIGFRGSIKVIDKKPYPAYFLFAYGQEEHGKEALAKEIGVILEDDIPEFISDLGNRIAREGITFEEFLVRHPQGIEETAAKYLKA